MPKVNPTFGRYLFLLVSVLLSALSALGYDNGVSIGLNFGADESAANGGKPTSLSATDIGGLYRQGNWNNLNGASGTAAALNKDAAGAPSPTTASVTWSSP